MYSVDVSHPHCDFAQAWTQVFGDTVRIVRQDSVEFLNRFSGPIDVLYLDLLDTTESGHAEHALRELQAALPKLHDKSLVVLDDTPWQQGAWIGKGALAVPQLLNQGWNILYAGYQVVLHRET
jgi:spermidine synthase